MVGIIYIKAGSDQFIRRAHTTEFAGRGCIWIGQVAASTRDVRVHILATRLPQWRYYVDQLDRRTLDLLSTDS